jgi:hypothetical protein
LFLGERLDQVHFEVRAIQRYIDTKPLRQKLEAVLRARFTGAAAGTQPDGSKPGRW